MQTPLDFRSHQSDTGGIENKGAITMTIKAHPHYTSNDYNYLKAKGWTDDEIITRWNEEHARGTGPCRWDSPMAQTKLKSVLKTN